MFNLWDTSYNCQDWMFLISVIILWFKKLVYAVFNVANSLFYFVLPKYVCRSATYARQLAQKQQKDNADPPVEREPTKLKGTQLSSEDSGRMKDEEEGLDALKSKKDKYELSSLVKSIKMKSKQVQLPSDNKTRKDGKSYIKGMKKKRH